MQQNCTVEYKTRHDWAGRVIHWKLGKRLNYDYMHKPESFLEYETHEILRDF